MLSRDLGITDIGYSYIVNSFLIVYAVMYIVAGRIIDALGARMSLGLAVIWWSAVEMLHGFANGVLFLCAARALLAMGEAAIIPSSVKVVAEVFFAEAEGNGNRTCRAWPQLWSDDCSTACSLGGPACRLAKCVYLDRLIRNLLGDSLVVELWMLRRRGLREDRTVSPGQASLPWRTIFRSKGVWAVGFGRFFGDPVWYFYLFWLPKYLHESGGLSLNSIGAMAWIPYAASMLGGLAGGAALKLADQARHRTALGAKICDACEWRSRFGWRDLHARSKPVLDNVFY